MRAKNGASGKATTNNVQKLENDDWHEIIYKFVSIISYSPIL